MKILTFLFVLGGLLSLPYGTASGKSTAPSKQPAALVDQAALKDSARVEGKYVNIGDLFTNAGESANIPVAYAPAPGKVAVFDARWLYKVSQAYNLNWRPLSSKVQIRVERDSQLISREEIEERIQLKLIDLGADPELKVILGNRNFRLYVPSNTLADITVESAEYSPSNNRFSAIVSTPTNDANTKRIRLTGRLERMSEVPVLNRRLLSNEIIRSQDISWINVSSRRLQRDAIIDVNDLIGKAARRGIRAGIPLRSTMVQAPVLVSKGSLVTISLIAGKMSLTSQGKALQNGSDGEAIQILNTQSNTIIQAEVIGNGQVAVYLTRTVAMN